jgi:cystathionine beta-lyase
MPQSFAKGIIAWNKKRYGVDVNPDLLGITTGVHPGLIAALRTFSPPGSKVLLLTPTYNGFYGDLTYTHTVPEESLMKYSNGRYAIDFEDLERRMGPDTKTLILCNPQNPTGNCWSREDLMTLGEICTRRRVIVLADEIHCDFVRRGERYTPYASLPNEKIVMNSVTFKSASKSFNLAAMKCAYMFSSNPAYLARIKTVGGHREDINTLGMIAHRAAYDEGADWLDQLLPYIDSNLEFVDSYVRSNIPSIKVVKPQGTYLAWLDVSAVADKIGAKEMAAQTNRKKAPGAADVTPETIMERYFVEHAKVQMNAGSGYGTGSAGRMRMNCGTSRKLLELALTNIASAVNKA